MLYYHALKKGDTLHYTYNFLIKFCFVISERIRFFFSVAMPFDDINQKKFNHYIISHVNI